MPTTAAPAANPPVKQSNPQQVALALKAVIESVYTDGISAILKTTQSTDGTITGKFADGPQVYDFSISPTNQITYNEAEATGGRSDSYLIGYTMDSGLGLRGERLDAPTSGQKTPKCEKGKRCGGACVQEGLACRQTLSPQASQAMVPIRSEIASHPAVAKANAEASQKAKEVSQKAQPSQSAQTPSTKGLKADHVALAAGAALIGMPLAAYLSARLNYRIGFNKSAEMAKKQAEEISKQNYQPSDYEKQKAKEAGAVLPKNEKMVPDVLYGGTTLSREIAVQTKGEDRSSLPLAKQVTLVVNGFDTTGNTYGSSDIANTLMGKEFSDHHIVPISNKGFSLEGKVPGPKEFVKEQSAKVIKEGRNPVAVRLAATAYAFHQKHPDLPINLVGYSGGGMATHEAAEILKKMNVPVKVANFGTPYFGMTETGGNSITFSYPDDFVTKKTPVKNEINVNGVKDHYSYLKDSTVRSKLKDYFDGKPVTGEKKVPLSKEEVAKTKAKADRRRKALERVAKSKKASSQGKKDSSDSINPQLQKFVAALLKPAIRQVYSDVSQVANVELKGTGVTGIFSDSNGDVFQFEITSSGQLTYKAATRKDAEQDQCEKGMQCGASCVPQGEQCNSGLSASGQAIVQLAIKTLKTEGLPSRLEVARAMGTATKEFLRNPVKALKEGTQREIAVREAIKVQTGIIVPSQTAILKKAGQKMTTFVKGFVKKNAEEGVVNTAGLAGSIAGGAVAGPIGALAGDLAGAVATRKAITDYKALQRAKSKLADDEAFKSAGALSKLKILGAATLAELKTPEMQREIEDNATGDVAGWAIGNASAVALTAMGVNIPLKGAAVAIATTPSVVKAHRRIREGEAAGKVIREAARDLVNLPQNVISRGEDREKAVRQEATRKIKGLKAAAATTAGVAGVAAVRKLISKD